MTLLRLTPVQMSPEKPKRRPAPPRHLADLDAAGRRSAVAALGEREFRAGQMSAHYFGRLARNPEAMTDLPAASREKLGKELLPTLLTPVRELDCDGFAMELGVIRADERHLRLEELEAHDRGPGARSALVVDFDSDFVPDFSRVAASPQHHGQPRQRSQSQTAHGRWAAAGANRGP